MYQTFKNTRRASIRIEDLTFERAIFLDFKQSRNYGFPFCNLFVHYHTCGHFHHAHKKTQSQSIFSGVKGYLKWQAISQDPKSHSSKDQWPSQQLVLFKLSLSQIHTASSNEPDSALVKYPLSLAQRLAFTCCDLLNWVKRTVRGYRYSEVLSESHFLCSFAPLVNLVVCRET